MEKIKKLDDRAQSREKLSIWFGSRDNFYHPIKEMVANAADELKNNTQENATIKITLSKVDGSYKKITVEDNGRGIPIGEETDGIPNYELLFLTLFAGTKYDVTERTSTGTNGVGNTAICYTSDLFEVDSWYKGYHNHIKFENGGILSEPLTREKCDKEKHGSKFSFILEKGVYSDNVFEIAPVKDIVKHFSVAALNIKFIFECETDDELITKEYHYETYKDYFDEMVGKNTTSKIFTLGDVKFEENVDILKENGVEANVEKNFYNIQITTVPEEIQEAYLNMTHLEQGGSINQGILDGIRLYLNKYCRDNKLFPKGITFFNKDDVANSVAFLAIVESNNVEFSNQTKLSTEKKTYGDNVKEYITNLLEASSVEFPKDFKKFVSHILEVQKHNSANDKARKRLKKKLTERVEGIGNKVKKLIDCEQHGDMAELFITEGDSANGSIVDSRDDEFQAAYPLRGKLINTLKANIDDVFKNQEIIDLVKIIGTGITDSKKKKGDFDISKSRFGKIIITTDADPDGAQIATLVLVFIYRFLNPLLENGSVYVAKTPLYELKFEDDSVVYFLSEDDKNKNINKYKNKKFVMNRLKGLGELDAQTMHETTMNPETRSLTKLTVEDAKEAEEMLLDWMDKDISARKRMITEQLPNYIDLSE